MVVFDLDDPLYFEADYVRSAVDAVATFVAGCSDMTFEVAKAIVQSAPSVGAGFDLLAERVGTNVNGEHLSAAAMVKVFPEPVTPKRVCSSSPSCKPRTSFSMAWG